MNAAGVFPLAVFFLMTPLPAAADRVGPPAARPEIDELGEEEARRARLREAGRQAERLREHMDRSEQERLRREYPAVPTAIATPPSPDSIEPKADAPLPVSPKQEAEGRCDGFTREMEAVIREEMRGGSPAAMEQLATRRQQIYLSRLRAGC